MTTTRWALAALLLAAAAAPRAWAADPVVQIVNSTAIPFSAAKVEDTLWPTVHLPAGVNAKEVHAALLSVQFNKTPVAGITRHFKVEPTLVDEKRQTPSLDIRITEIDKLLPGEYQLSVQLTEAGKALGAPLTVALERRAAEFQAPGKQTLIARADWPLFGTGSGLPSALQLTPVGGKVDTRVFMAPKVIEGPFKDSDGIPYAASLGASAAPAASGQPLTVTLTPTDFPIGITQGKIELRSSELKAPMVVDVEVRTRLASWWIVLIVAFGIWLGYLLRVVLQRRLDLAQARGLGLAALDRLQQQVAPIADAAFQQAVAPQLGALGKALLEDDGNAIGTLASTAETQVKQALVDLQARLDGAQTTLLALRKLDAGTGTLPASMQSAVAALRAPCTQAAERLALRDASTASAVLDATEASVSRALLDEGSRWIAHLGTLNVRARALLALLDSAQATSRGLADGTPFHTLPAPLLALPQAAGLAGLAMWLDAWRAYGITRLAALGTWLGYLGNDSDALIAMATVRMPAGSNALQREQHALAECSASLARQVEAVLTSGDSFSLPPLDLMSWHAAAAALVQAVLAARTDLDPANRASAMQSLDTDDYFGALKAVPRHAGANTNDTALAASARVGLRAGRLAVLLCNEVRALVHDAQIPAISVDPTLLDVMRTQNRVEAQRLGRQQTGLVGAILVIASYMLFSKSFVGAPLELGALFFWGFSADLTAASLASRVTDWAAKAKV